LSNHQAVYTEIVKSSASVHVHCRIIRQYT